MIVSFFHRNRESTSKHKKNNNPFFCFTLYFQQNCMAHLSKTHISLRNSTSSSFLISSNICSYTSVHPIVPRLLFSLRIISFL